MKAALCRQFNAPLEIEQVRCGKPGPDEVKIAIESVAVCHSDISFIKGYWGGSLPAIYGHEAAGRIIERGSTDSPFAAGDRVIVTLMRSCGSCFSCAAQAEALCISQPASSPDASIQTDDGNSVWPAMHTGAFAEEVIVHESQIVPLPDDISMDLGALMGCGVITGYGAVKHVAKLSASESVAIVGCGGVGANAIQAARIMGASVIMALDSSQDKKDICMGLGATHFTQLVSDSNYADAKAATDDIGYDVVLVAVGSAEVISQALSLLKTGGRLIVMGMPPSGALSEIEMTNLASYGQTITGTKMGMALIKEDIPEILDYYRNGQWELDALISKRFHFSQINQALEAAQQPDTMRIIINMHQAEN